MILSVQLKLLIFSFLYGIFLGVVMRFNYKLLYNSDYVLKILATFLLVISSVLLYFVILLKINYGIVHYYSFLTIILGFMLETFVELKLMPVIVEKYFKK